MHDVCYFYNAHVANNSKVFMLMAGADPGIFDWGGGGGGVQTLVQIGLLNFFLFIYLFIYFYLFIYLFFLGGGINS